MIEMRHHVKRRVAFIRLVGGGGCGIGVAAANRGAVRRTSFERDLVAASASLRHADRKVVGAGLERWEFHVADAAILVEVHCSASREGSARDDDVLSADLAVGTEAG